jgi:hypothetical protein
MLADRDEFIGSQKYNGKLEKSFNPIDPARAIGFAGKVAP